jgi:hypothetical protein
MRDWFRIAGCGIDPTSARIDTSRFRETPVAHRSNSSAPSAVLTDHRIAHIGVLVADLERARKHWSIATGIPCSPIFRYHMPGLTDFEQREPHAVDLRQSISFDTDPWIQLIEFAPNGTHGAARGEGGHHLGFPMNCPQGARLMVGKQIVEELPVIPHADRMYYEILETTRCVREGLLESPLLPLDETISIVETLDEIRRQIGVRYPFELPGEGRRWVTNRRARDRELAGRIGLRRVQAVCLSLRTLFPAAPGERLRLRPGNSSTTTSQR